MEKVIEGASVKDTENDINKVPQNANEAFDLILNSVGGCGKWQWKIGAICGLCGIFTSFHHLGAVFLAATPDYWCAIPHLNVNETLMSELRNFTTPWEVNKDGQQDYSRCFYYDIDYNGINTVEESEMLFNSFTNPKKVPCQSWYYDSSDSTLVTEWDLVCSRRYMMSLIQATYMFGVLLGSIVFSVISDKCGRRKSSILCTVIFFVSAATAGLSQSLEMLMFLRFLTASSGQGLYLINYTITMEAIGTKFRAVIPALSFSLSILGTLLLSLIAYFIRSWRTLQFVNGISICILFVYYWILPESPRWLFMQGKVEEGLLIMENIAKSNKRALPPKKEMEKYLDIISRDSFKTEKKGNWGKLRGIGVSILTLVRTPNMRRRSIIVFYGWFITCAVYYGLSFSGYNLNVSSYILVFLIGITELLQAFIKVPVLLKFGRRTLLSSSLITCGLMLLSILLIPLKYVWLKIISTVIARTMVGFSFTGCYSYSTELAPTNIRNASLGAGSMMGRIGSIVAPFIVDLLGEINYAIPSILFGCMAVLSGLLSFLLPETAFVSLPESIDEIEAMPR